MPRISLVVNIAGTPTSDCDVRKTTEQVVPVSDFDAEFEAFGAKLPKRFQSKRKVPPQLTFAAEDRVP